MKKCSLDCLYIMLEGGKLKQDKLQDRPFTEYVTPLSQKRKEEILYKKYYPTQATLYLNRIVGTQLLTEIPKEKEYIDKVMECFNIITLKIKETTSKTYN